MSHRAGQVIDRIAYLIRERVQSKGTKTYTHRRLSLSVDQDEMSAISVDFGDDTIDAEGEDYIDSTLAVFVTALVQAPTESQLREKLLELRSQVHIAIAADRTLGLEFVIDLMVEGGGNTTAPEVDVSGEQPVGSMTSTWPVKYRMNFEDPEAMGSVPNL